MAEGGTLEGGCLCGAVRYRIEGGLKAAGATYCHCSLCRKASGAPVMAWATFPTAALWVTQGTPASYQATPTALRQFCRDCGTQLFFSYTVGEPELDVSIASLDTPEAVRPSYHIWAAETLPWLDITDELPRYPDDGPDGSPERDALKSA
ncbi:MAG TPA: GFA family protein [Azospirillaceae bacterium]|nr:GFA family protein [Azospirillaceae bacterium]